MPENSDSIFPNFSVASLSVASVVVVSLSYLAILFLVAQYGERRAEQGKSVLNANIYALSIAVYCTTWTFFGSVGMAAATGYTFLAIFLGPTITMFFSIVILKILRISKTFNITSIADFISTRYGKSQFVAGLVSIIALIGLIPYIALQLKAISVAISVMIKPHSWEAINREITPIKYLSFENIFTVNDPALWIALSLALFTIFFGTGSTDNVKRHEGLILAIAFESLVKLIAFMAVGIFVTFFVFDGASDIANKAISLNNGHIFLKITDNELPNWIAYTVLSAFAILVLPRQFQVMIVENVQESHLSRAIWMFPLYLLLINIFVLPIAIGGLYYFQATSVSPDIFVISLPLANEQSMLAILVFIGCLSAGTAMVIVEAKALSTMICNDLIMPIILRGLWQLPFFKKHQEHNFSQLIIFIRRLAIIVILQLGYVYYKVAGSSYALVNMGLISFIAVAQFAPALLGGIYWKNGNKSGAIAGLIGGFFVWYFTALYPSLVHAGVFSNEILTYGLFGNELFRADALFGLSSFSEATHSFFWSMFINVTLYIGVSILTKQSISESVLARQFVDVFRRQSQNEEQILSNSNLVENYGLVLKGNFSDLYHLVERFIGKDRALLLLNDFANLYKINSNNKPAKETTEILNLPLTVEMINFVENRLAGAIGQASAKVMISGVLQKDELDIEDVVRVLDEAVNIRSYSSKLEKDGEQLREENTNLQKKDRQKDDYIATLSHELRTPLTSIRTFSELLINNKDVRENEKNKFLNIIVSETDRLSRMINQILDIAKIESGQVYWQKTEQHLLDIVEDAMTSLTAIYRDKKVLLNLAHISDDPVVFVDRDRLLQVLQNLLINALKFSPKEVGEVNIKIQCETDDLGICDLVRVYIEDNGKGIAEEDLENIFLKYHQSTKNLADNPKGTGLGLHISRHIIENFGGRIWAENVADLYHNRTGAIFIFTLPVIEI